MTTKTLNESDLAHFTGTMNWYRHPLNRKVVFTDGAKHVADEGGAYWLLDKIALLQLHGNRIAAIEFQFWKLTVREDRTATLICEDGNGNAVYTEDLTFTDFPLAEITLYFTNNTIYLPSEH